MSFSFKEWIKRKPKDPVKNYIKQSSVAIVLSVMFFLFLLGQQWLDDPKKIATTSETILVPYLSLKLLGSLLSNFLNSFIFGIYDLFFQTKHYAFLVLKNIAFYGVLVFFFLSLGLGFWAGFIGKNKKILISYALISLVLFVLAFYINIYIYFIFVVLGLLVNFLILNYVLKGESDGK